MLTLTSDWVIFDDVHNMMSLTQKASWADAVRVIWSCLWSPSLYRDSAVPVWSWIMYLSPCQHGSSRCWHKGVVQIGFCHSMSVIWDSHDVLVINTLNHLMLSEAHFSPCNWLVRFWKLWWGPCLWALLLWVWSPGHLSTSPYSSHPFWALVQNIIQIPAPVTRME